MNTTTTKPPAPYRPLRIGFYVGLYADAVKRQGELGFATLGRYVVALIRLDLLTRKVVTAADTAVPMVSTPSLDLQVMLKRDVCDAVRKRIRALKLSNGREYFTRLVSTDIECRVLDVVASDKIALDIAEGMQ